ncbi:MAG TPA: polysaccharide biosynthesis/export family protein [Terriglobia bacterium]|nr:polysaccharide biosynthesis/export family protein [Terriglobia bacterium]
MSRVWLCLAALVVVGTLNVSAQSAGPSNQTVLTAGINNTQMETTDDWNRRLESLVHSALSSAQNTPSPGDYRIGSNDQLQITVLDAPDLTRAVRVGGDGDISLPLLGTIKAAGLTPRELELVLQALLRRTYMKDPQVSVTVTEMQSHSVSVLGAVKMPGVFQIRGTKTLLEMLSMAQGLAPEAGDAVLVMRGPSTEIGSALSPKDEVKSNSAAGATSQTPVAISSGSSLNSREEGTIEISLKRLLDSGDPKYNVSIYPGDIIKVKAAGIVYVVGDLNRPGGFPVKDNEHITVLQAIALAEGTGPDANKNKARIIRVAENGQQVELPVRLKEILSGKAPDFALKPKDVLFIPKNGTNSAAKGALRTLSQWIVWRAVP